VRWGGRISWSTAGGEEGGDEGGGGGGMEGGGGGGSRAPARNGSQMHAPPPLNREGRAPRLMHSVGPWKTTRPSLCIVPLFYPPLRHASAVSTVTPVGALVMPAALMAPDASVLPPLSNERSESSTSKKVPH
jgi:hypothetical protein